MENRDLEMDAVDAGGVSLGGGGPSVNVFRFHRNRRIMAMVLSPHMKEVMLKVLNDSPSISTVLEERVRSRLLLDLVEGRRNCYDVTLEVLDYVVASADGDRPTQLLSEMGMYGELTTTLQQMLKDLCGNCYIPKVSTSMMQLIRNRSKDDQWVILEHLRADVKKTDETLQCPVMMASSGEVTAEGVRKVVQWWLYCQQQYGRHRRADAEGMDLDGEEALEKLVTVELQFPAAPVPLEMADMLRESLGVDALRRVVRKMHYSLNECSLEPLEPCGATVQDLGALCKLMGDWLLDQQRRKMILQPLNPTTCWQYMVKMVQASIPFSELPEFLQPGQSRYNMVERPVYNLPMANIKTRFDSFGTEWDRRHAGPSRVTLAANGMYLKRWCWREPREDQTQCYQCGVVLKDWEKQDDPDIEHMWWSDGPCPFMVKHHGYDIVHFIATLKQFQETKPKTMSEVVNMYSLYQ